VYCHFQDPKRKVHKPVKATLRLEVERITPEDNDMDRFSETSSVSNGSGEGELRLGETSLRSSGKLGRTLFNGRPKWTASDRNDSGKQRFTNFATGSSPDHGSLDVYYLLHQTLVDSAVRFPQLKFEHIELLRSSYLAFAMVSKNLDNFLCLSNCIGFCSVGHVSW
jgi:hypothetical protein